LIDRVVISWKNKTETFLIAGSSKL
jgi:hypothetical protein